MKFCDFSGASREGRGELERGGAVGHQLQEAQQPAHGHLQQEEEEESFRVVKKGWKPF